MIKAKIPKLSLINKLEIYAPNPPIAFSILLLEITSKKSLLDTMLSSFFQLKKNEKNAIIK